MPEEEFVDTTPLHVLVINWLNQEGYKRASFERIISSVPGASTYDQLRQMVNGYPNIFRSCVIKYGLEGLALQDTFVSIPNPTVPAPVQGDMLEEDLHSEPLPAAPEEPSLISNVEKLIKKASNAGDAESALQFAQAAICIAQSLTVLNDLKK